MKEEFEIKMMVNMYKFLEPTATTRWWDEMELSTSCENNMGFDGPDYGDIEDVVIKQKEWDNSDTGLKNSRDIPNPNYIS